MRPIIFAIGGAILTLTVVLHRDLRRLSRTVSTCELDVQSSKEQLRAIRTSLAESQARLGAFKAGAN